MYVKENVLKLIIIFWYDCEVSERTSENGFGFVYVLAMVVLAATRLLRPSHRTSTRPRSSRMRASICSGVRSPRSSRMRASISALVMPACGHSVVSSSRCTVSGCMHFEY